MRHLVVCCDGTWNTLDQMRDGVPCPTNVARLYHALIDRADQLRYYHPGVGVGPGVIDRLGGAAVGAGLSANIKSAYSWLAANYRDGDAVCLFGFSRGAYTVRSVAGMLHACGLPTLPEDMPPVQRWELIDRLYDETYRRPDGAGPPPYPQIWIQFLGVWDTVGALGIPDFLGPLRLLDVERRHRFHDTRLGERVRHARHAVALDEQRGTFTPTLWTDLPARDGPDRSVRQIWFPGCHTDVGGGYLEKGLSDGALAWMIQQAQACTGLEFDPKMVAQVRPDPGEALHDSCTGFYRRIGPCPRAVPFVGPTGPTGPSGDGRTRMPDVHPSACARQADPPITVGSYRPGRMLSVGEQATCPVYASEPWNATGWFLEPGRYEFEAVGEWLDGSRRVGPDGSGVGRPLPQLGDLAAVIVDWVRGLGAPAVDRDAALEFGARRAGDRPWMALLGVVAAADVDEQGAQRPYAPFLIGGRSQHVVPRPGYLYAFANDVWGFYDNNRGSVALTVRRVE